MLVLPNVNYYLNPTMIEFQIPSSTGEKRDEDCWLARDRMVRVGDVIDKITFNQDLEGDEQLSLVESSG